MIGYFPVAVAFGAAAGAAHVPPAFALAISLFVYSGASQFLLLAALGTGATIPAVIGLCALISLRHLLYGPLLGPRLPAARPTRLAFALGLTDEVFATCLAKSGVAHRALAAPWLAGLALSVYASWIAGTAVGAWLGASLESRAPTLAEAAGFALPALFIAVAAATMTRPRALPMLVSAAVALLVARFGSTALAIFAGAGAGCAFGWARR